MILSDSYSFFYDSLNRPRKRRIVEASCDKCKKRFAGNSRSVILQHHFCSRQCFIDAKQVGEILDVFCKKKLIEKYGVDNVMKLPEKVAKAQSTNIRKYGMKYASMTKDVKKKTAKTCLKKYGEVSPMKNKNVFLKSRSTTLKNHEVEFPLQNEIILQKFIKTNNDIYGGNSPMSNAVIKEKTRKTLVKNYGVENSFLINDIKLKANSTDACLKRHETIKKNGRMRSSSVEDRVYKILSSKFNDVRRWVLCLGFSNDIYIASENVFIQIDGVYWHGLDRPVFEIEKSALSGCVRDAIILKKNRRDKLQNKVYEENRKKLIRITDKKINVMSDIEIYEYVCGNLR